MTKHKIPIDSFGVGTDLVTSRDDSALPGIYKLVSIKHRGQTVLRAKTSTGKRTVPGTKQVYRRYDHQGMIIRDVIALASEIPPPRMKPLLTEIIRGGQLITPLPNLDVIRNVARDELDSLPDKYRRIRGSVNPPVRFSNLLERLTKSLWSNAK